ncbi:MAG: hypothetical protein ACOH2H_15450 [Cypionkella sp.]
MKMIQSDPDFLAKLRQAAKRGPTAEELHAQKVSFIASSLSDGKTVVTVEQVERELKRMSREVA